MNGGTVTLTRSSIEGATAFGIAAEPGFALPGDLTTVNVVLDTVQIDAGDTGLSYWTADRGQLRLRGSRVSGARHGLVLVLGGDAIDLGTADSPGGNQVVNTSSGPALEDQRSGGAIDAHGTTLNGMSFGGVVEGPVRGGAYTLSGTTFIRF